MAKAGSLSLFEPIFLSCVVGAIGWIVVQIILLRRELNALRGGYDPYNTRKGNLPEWLYGLFTTNAPESAKDEHVMDDDQRIHDDADISEMLKPPNTQDNHYECNDDVLDKHSYAAEISAREGACVSESARNTSMIDDSSESLEATVCTETDGDADFSPSAPKLTTDPTDSVHCNGDTTATVVDTVAAASTEEEIESVTTSPPRSRRSRNKSL